MRHCIVDGIQREVNDLNKIAAEELKKFDIPFTTTSSINKIKEMCETRRIRCSDEKCKDIIFPRAFKSVVRTAHLVHPIGSTCIFSNENENNSRYAYLSKQKKENGYDMKGKQKRAFFGPLFKSSYKFIYHLMGDYVDGTKILHEEKNEKNYCISHQA